MKEPGYCSGLVATSSPPACQPPLVGEPVGCHHQPRRKPASQTSRQTGPLFATGQLAGSRKRDDWPMGAVPRWGAVGWLALACEPVPHRRPVRSPAIGSSPSWGTTGLPDACPLAHSCNWSGWPARPGPATRPRAPAHNPAKFHGFFMVDFMVSYMVKPP